MSINRYICTGNLTRDCEVRRTQSGMVVVAFGIAVNDRRKNSQTGDWEDQVNYLDCVMFGTRAESLSQYLQKGKKLAIEGKLRYSSWEKDGYKRSKVEVVVDDIELLGGNGGNSHSGNNYGSGQQTYDPPIEVEPSLYDDKIPF